MTDHECSSEQGLLGAKICELFESRLKLGRLAVGLDGTSWAVLGDRLLGWGKESGFVYLWEGGTFYNGYLQAESTTLGLTNISFSPTKQLGTP